MLTQARLNMKTHRIVLIPLFLFSIAPGLLTIPVALRMFGFDELPDMGFDKFTFFHLIDAFSWSIAVVIVVLLLRSKSAVLIRSRMAVFFVLLLSAFALSCLIYIPEALIGTTVWMIMEPSHGVWLLLLAVPAVLVWCPTIKKIFGSEMRSVIFCDPSSKVGTCHPFVVLTVIPPLVGILVWVLVSRNPNASQNPLINFAAIFMMICLLRGFFPRRCANPLIIILSYELLFSYTFAVIDWWFRFSIRFELIHFPYSVALFGAREILERTLAFAIAYGELLLIYQYKVFGYLRCEPNRAPPQGN
jgi:hypothetical protein